ncbi:MAG: alpha/beta hydrolase [archaeon]
MTYWSGVQDERITKTLHGDPAGVIHEDIAQGKVHGTLYYKKPITTTRAVLIVHGFSGNRYGLGVLATRLAAYSFFCLSIDLPGHFLNPNGFTIGEVCDTINEGVLLLRRRYNMRTIAVLGHSIGAVSTLFASAGYDSNVERDIYTIWEEMRWLLEREKDLLDSNAHDVMRVQEEIGHEYARLKQIMLAALKKNMASVSSISCLVLLSPSRNSKTAIPGIGLLRRMPQRAAKTIFEWIFHKPAVQQLMREGNPVAYVEENRKDTIYWQFFKMSNHKEFLKYVCEMKEPSDFLELLERLAAFENKDESTTFFAYYLDKYVLRKQKLFIYGQDDLYLKPFWFGNRNRLEKFYRSCGNARIIHGDFTHVMLNETHQQLAAVSVKNDTITDSIIAFLDKNM